MSLAVVRDLRVARAPATAEDLAALQADVLAGFVLARAAAGLPDETIASDVLHVEQVRAWSGRPPGPGKVRRAGGPQDERVEASSSGGPPGTPRRRDGRSLPPV